MANNGPLRNFNINWIFLLRLLIQNHLKLPITEKRRNQANCLTWNSIRPEFMKKSSMPNSAESLGYIKCYSSSSPRPVKSCSNFIRHNCQKISSWSRRPKMILEIKEKATFRSVINNYIIVCQYYYCLSAYYWLPVFRKADIW